MKQFWLRFLKLNIGLVLFALGIVLTLQANIGYSPWEIFHSGISRVTGISIGMVSIIVGVIIAVAAIIGGEKFGLGSILNMFIIGYLIDLLLDSNIIPVADNLLYGTFLMVLGLYIIAVGSYFYIGAGFGAGPRDSLMISINKKTNLPIGLVRGLIEASAAVVGWLLGGMVGIGTIIGAFGIGICVQTTFKLLRFDAAVVTHETLAETIASFRNR